MYLIAYQQLPGISNAFSWLYFNRKKFHNIGEVSEQQVQFLDGHLQLVYTNGEPCPEDPTKHVTTRILLYCSKDSIVSSCLTFIIHARIGEDQRYILVCGVVGMGSKTYFVSLFNPPPPHLDLCMALSL